MLTLQIIIAILTVLVIVLCIAIRNILLKVEKYEDVVLDQTQYLQNISNVVGESKKHLQKLDENGVFKQMMRSVISLNK